MRFKITALSLQICLLIVVVVSLITYSFFASSSGEKSGSPTIAKDNQSHMHDQFQLVARDSKRTKILEVFKVPKKRFEVDMPDHLPNFLEDAVTVHNPAGDLPDPTGEIPFSIVIVSVNEPLLAKTVDEVLAVESHQLINEVGSLL